MGPQSRWPFGGGVGFLLFFVITATAEVFVVCLFLVIIAIIASSLQFQFRLCSGRAWVLEVNIRVWGFAIF